jgi:hypothetical protein
MATATALSTSLTPRRLPSCPLSHSLGGLRVPRRHEWRCPLRGEERRGARVREGVLPIGRRRWAGNWSSILLPAWVAADCVGVVVGGSVSRGGSGHFIEREDGAFHCLWCFRNI